MNRSEASRKVVEKHSTEQKVWREEVRTTTGSRTKKVVRPPEFFANFELEALQESLAESSHEECNQREGG